MATAVVEFTKDQKKLLKAIEKAGNTAPEYLMVERNADTQALVDSGAIVLNEGITDGSKVAARINAADDEAAMTLDGNTTEVVTGPKLEVVAGIPMAEAKRGGKKEEKYPFSAMQVGDSFLVPVDEKYKEPWKTFASTVSSATRRFKDDGRKFTLRRVTKGDKYPNGYTEPESGARVFRTA
jgi:hypothetical protein